MNIHMKSINAMHNLIRMIKMLVQNNAGTFCTKNLNSISIFENILFILFFSQLLLLLDNTRLL